MDTLVVGCYSPPIIKRVRQKRLAYNCTRTGQSGVSQCIFDGGETGSTGAVKACGDQKQNLNVANDNVAFETRLAA